MKGGSKMDYGKIANILSIIYYDGVDLAGLEYLPSDYWTECEEQLILATYVSAGWVELTDDGKAQIEFAWRVLCDVRDLDPDVMYDSPIDFFQAQAADADVIPIKDGK